MIWRGWTTLVAAAAGVGVGVALTSDLGAHRRISTAFAWDDVAPVLTRRCGDCHGGPPVSLATYAAARPWVAAIREEILLRRIRPLRNDTGPHARWPPLSPLEVERLVAWIDGGAPERRPVAVAAGEYWCPMHADVRAAEPATCPHCGMGLVAFVPDFSESFQWSIEPRSDDQWRVRLRHEDGRPVSTLVPTHERPFHLFAVRDDLTTFAHLHPVPSGPGLLEVTWPAPAGRYRFFAEAFPEGAAPQLLTADVSVAPHRGSTRLPPLDESTDLSGTFTVVAGVRAGQVHTLRFTLRDAHGAVPENLRPYLGADAHVFAAHESLDDALHGHPETGIAGTDLSRGLLEVDLLLARSGRYRIWLQVQQGKRVHTLPFDYSVS